MPGASGTKFQIVDFSHAIDLVARRHRELWPASDIEEMAAQCRAGDILCLRSHEAVIVVELKPQDDSLELWLRLGIGQAHGAFHRAEADIVSIAKDMGARTIAFGPGRRGWRKILGQHWFLRGDEFVRFVDEVQKADH